jgi:hypothetical protein
MQVDLLPAVVRVDQSGALPETPIEPRSSLRSTPAVADPGKLRYGDVELVAGNEDVGVTKRPP